MRDTPVPEPGPGEVRVRVHAVSINHLDLWTRKGIPGVKLPLPIIPGADVAGVVEKLGPGVQRWSVGDNVILYPAVSCGKCGACIRGRENYCRSYQVLGHRRDGGYAEFIVVPEVNLLPRPERLSFEESAAFPLVFLTAWHMLVTLAHVRPGEDVLVTAGGSGVGSAAIQIANFLGARVFTTAGTEEKRRKALELGAYRVYDHYQPGWSEKVLEDTHKEGIDIVVDHVGEALWPDIVRCMGWYARFVTCGATTGTNVQVNLRHLFAKQWSLFGAYMGSRGELMDLWPLVNEGRLRPIVDSIFPLQDASRAHEYVEAKKHFGKVVLKVIES